VAPQGLGRSVCRQRFGTLAPMADDSAGPGNSGDGDVPDPWSRPFDDGFVAGARYQEPSADERVRDLKSEGQRIRRERKEQARRRRRADLKGRVAQWWPWAVFVLIAAALVVVQQLR
jgi:hypothetical protein